MWSKVSSALLAGSLVSLASSVEASSPSSCTTGIVRLSVSATSQRFSSTVQPPSSPLDVANYYRSQYSANSNFTAQSTPTGSNANAAISGSFGIYTKVCLPTSTKWSGVVQVLTHGLDLDHRYWENPSNLQYSWIDTATQAGHATVSYDRLGMGQSDHPDGLHVVQSAVDLEILNALTLYYKKDSRFTKATDWVAVGHSYGSILVAGLGGAYPSTFTKLILTGFTISLTGVPVAFMGFGSTIAYNQNSKAFGRWQNDTSYWTMESPGHELIVFFTPPYYDNAQFNYFESIKSVYTYGQLLTILGPIGHLPAKVFNGEILVVTGDKDFVFCGGDCYQQPQNIKGTSLLDDVASVFPAIKKFSTYVPVNTGHAANFHLSAPTTFEVVNKWLNGKYS